MMAYRTPAPKNQFYRLVWNAGLNIWSKSDRWNNVVQGVNYDSVNCTATVGARMLDAETDGHINIGPPGIRNHQHDFAGGIGWDDVKVAWRFYGEDLEIPLGVSWADVIQFLKEGHFVGIQGDYDAVPYEWQVQKGGHFDHAFGIDAYRSSDGRIKVGDPLGTSDKWQPQSSVRYAAETLALRYRGTRNRLFVAVSKVRGAGVIPVNYRFGGQPTGRGLYVTVKAGQHDRVAPHIDSAFVGDARPKGYEFRVSQTTFVGDVGGDGTRTWHGDRSGTRWFHASQVDPK